MKDRKYWRIIFAVLIALLWISCIVALALPTPSSLETDTQGKNEASKITAQSVQADETAPVSPALSPNQESTSEEGRNAYPNPFLEALEPLLAQSTIKPGTEENSYYAQLPNGTTVHLVFSNDSEASAFEEMLSQANAGNSVAYRPENGPDDDKGARDWSQQ